MKQEEDEVDSDGNPILVDREDSFVIIAGKEGKQELIERKGELKLTIRQVTQMLYKNPLELDLSNFKLADLS